MPRDVTGAYTLPEAPFVADTVAVSGKVNNVLADIGVEVGDSLARSGKGAMTADLPMGGHKIAALAAGTAIDDGVRLDQLSAVSTSLAAEKAARIAADLAAAAVSLALANALLPKDGSVAMTGVLNAPGLHVGASAAEAPLHIQAPALATGAGAFRNVASLGATDANLDRVVLQQVRSAAGSSYTTAETQLVRVVDSTVFGGVAWTADGGVALVAAGGAKGVKAGPAGEVSMAAPAGPVNIGAGMNDGCTFYPPGAGAGSAQVSASFAGAGGGVLALRRTGSIGDILSFYSGNAAVGGAPGNSAYLGGVNVNSSGGVSYATTSDYRLKQDAVPITGAVGAILAVPAITFAFKAAPDVRVQGFIAHEIQAVAPSAVSGVKDGMGEDGLPVYQSLDHSRLVPLLWAAVQELALRVHALESAPTLRAAGAGILRVRALR